MGRGMRWLERVGFYDKPSPVHVDGAIWYLSLSHWGLFPIAEFCDISD